MAPNMPPTRTVKISVFVVETGLFEIRFDLATLR